MASDLIEITPEGKAIYHFHKGQLRAWDSKARVTAIIAGSQSGKTSFGPLWLHREIQRRGPGDYLVATPTFTLLEVKALPEFRRLFEDLFQLGKYYMNPVRKFVFSKEGERRMFGEEQSTPTTVFFGYAAKPESLESMTAKGAWLDEAGQADFKVGSWEAIQRRLAIADGRVLITTTPYNVGWLKTRIWNRRKRDSGIKVVRFDSTENPNFPQDVMDRARAELPRWKFNMFYRGMFTRPAGLIYDNFNDDIHTSPRFPIPERWERYVGLDFGGVNTAAIFFAKEPGTSRFYAYREYKNGGLTARQHMETLMIGEPRLPTAYGGAKSEQQWRDEFRQAGFPIKVPEVSDVEVGIDRVYGALARSELVFFDDLQATLDEMNNYSRMVDEFGEPMEEIEDKNAYHMLDATRYIISSVTGKPVSTSVIFNPETEDEYDPDHDLAWGVRYTG